MLYLCICNGDYHDVLCKMKIYPENSNMISLLQFVAHEQVGEVAGIDRSDSICGCQFIVGNNVPSTLIVAVARSIRIAPVILSRWHRKEAGRERIGWVMLLVIGRGCFFVSTVRLRASRY